MKMSGKNTTPKITSFFPKCETDFSVQPQETEEDNVYIRALMRKKKDVGHVPCVEISCENESEKVVFFSQEYHANNITCPLKLQLFFQNDFIHQEKAFVGHEEEVESVKEKSTECNHQDFVARIAELERCLGDKVRFSNIFLLFIIFILSTFYG